LVNVEHQWIGSSQTGSTILDNDQVMGQDIDLAKTQSLKVTRMELGQNLP